MKIITMTRSILLFASIIFCASLQSYAQSMGNLIVQGKPGAFQAFQKVKVIRCVAVGNCDNAIFFSLEQTQPLLPGYYLVGYENSIYPDLVTIRAGITTTLKVHKIEVPTRISEGKVRIYRDMRKLGEQNKIYLTMFMMKRHFSRLDKENTGDLYLTGVWDRDFVQRFNHSYCSSVTAKDRQGKATGLPSDAVTACAGWNGAKSPKDLKTLYKFNADGTFDEMLVTFPGIVTPVKHPRYLVSLPMKTTDFVSVFPGNYVIESENKKTKIEVVIRNDSQNDNVIGNLLSDTQTFSNVNANDCVNASVWQTEHRAYCTVNTEDEEGCSRASARTCSAMDISNDK